MKLIPHYSQHPYYTDPKLHLLYLGDDIRVSTFKKSIREVVKPGMIVADIGTGTGILARFAVKAGARRVYAIEQHRNILELALRVNQESSINGCLELVEGDSRTVNLPERVDVIVAELIGGLGNDEAMSNILEDARNRFLKPGGIMIPTRVKVFICPISVPEAHCQIDSVYDDDLIVPKDKVRSPFKAYYEILNIPPNALLSGHQLLDSIDLLGHTPITFNRTFSFEIQNGGIMSGFIVWFRADLTGSVLLDTSPWSPCTCWGQSFFPIRNQAKVKRGDIVELIFSAVVPKTKDRPFYIWEGFVKRNDTQTATFYESNEL
jgi:protein arginine N-methyltransferase 1